MATPQGDDRVDDRRRHGVRMRARGARAINERGDASLFIALDPLVSGCSTDAGVLTQRREGLFIV